MKRIALAVLSVLLLAACAEAPESYEAVPDDYLDYSGREDVLTEGVRMIPAETPKGTFRVWIKRIGRQPGMKVLILHGGPAPPPFDLPSFHTVDHRRRPT